MIMLILHVFYTFIVFIGTTQYRYIWFHQDFRNIELFVLEKTSKLIVSKHKLNTAKSTTQPRVSAPYLHIF